MKRRFGLFCLFLLNIFSLQAQDSLYVKDFVCEIGSLLPDTLKVKGPAEGFTIKGDYAFSFHAGGQLIVLDLKNQAFVNSFQLDCKKAHCNSANFGKAKYSSKSQFPLCYVSECGGTNACYVLDINENGADIVQIIKYVGKDAGRFFDWCVDAKGKYIYTYGGMHYKPKTLRKYRLPSLADSDANKEVHLTEEDLIEEYTIECVKIAQGNKVIGRHAYFTDGAGKLSRVHKVDLKTGEEKSWNISADAFEPEDLDKKGSWFYIQNYTGKSSREANIFKIKIK